MKKLIWLLFVCVWLVTTIVFLGLILSGQDSLRVLSQVSLNGYFYAIVGISLWFFWLDHILDALNMKHASPTLPPEAQEIYDEEKYATQQQYQHEKYEFGEISSVVGFVGTMLMLFLGGFWWLDAWLGNVGLVGFWKTLSFFGVVFVVQLILSIPFSYYSTFVIEEKYGFNKTTKSLFWSDVVKGLVLNTLIWWVLLWVIVWLWGVFWGTFWLLAWGVITGFMMFFMAFYTTLILPLFNKQTPLEDGSLKTAIVEFSKKVGFEIKDLYVMDGSKRSSKANAFFSWLWPQKRIVLFDTLINEMTQEEVVAVLAHEIGHYKKKHTLKMLVFSIVQMGITLWALSFFLQDASFQSALGVSTPSFQIGLVAFGFLFAPWSFVTSLLGNILSRKHEYEADAFAGTYYDPQALVSGLKKLSKNNLTNLTPHPWYEWVHSTHPTVLKRVKALEE